MRNFNLTTETPRGKCQERVQGARQEPPPSILHQSDTRYLFVSNMIFLGVYNPPFLPDGSKPSAFGLEVESHLKNTFKVVLIIVV
jgi:hypothetical protein